MAQPASMLRSCLRDQVAKAALFGQSCHGRALLFEEMVQLERMEHKLLRHVEHNLLDWNNYGDDRGNKNAARRTLPVF